MKEFLYIRLIDPLYSVLKQGITPKKLALSSALGAMLGVFPILGITSLLCFSVATVGRLNQIGIQVANYAVYPLQILLLLPFIRLGEFLFQAPPLPLSVNQIVDLVEIDVWIAMQTLWRTGLYAICAWALVSPLLTLLVYKILILLFKKMLPVVRAKEKDEPIYEI